MNPNIQSRSARLALGVGVVAGAWLILAASTLGVEAISSADTSAAAAKPDRMHLAQAVVAPVEKPVSYSSEQADRGKVIYDQECEDCHGADLRGGMNGGPPLRGLAFEGKYADGAPASGMYMFMFNLMPPNDPGRYSEKEYIDLMAYILQVNGFQDGAPMPSDPDALDYLIVQK